MHHTESSLRSGPPQPYRRPGWLGLLAALLVALSAPAAADRPVSDDAWPPACTASRCELPRGFPGDDYPFSGLAVYLGFVSYYRVDQHGLQAVEPGSQLRLASGQWFVAAGRFRAVTAQGPDLQITVGDDALVITDPGGGRDVRARLRLVDKSRMAELAPALDQLRYATLWAPLAWLTRLVEATLVALHEHLVSSWGWAIILLALLIKIVLLPVSALTVRLQRRVSRIQARLNPQLADIKAHYDGEEAHNRLMAAHKALGVTPFFTLAPMLATLIQIPVLIAVFNALGEMPQLDGQSFAWIASLAYPDSLGMLPLSLPLFGGQLSLLPVLMTAVTVLSVLWFENAHLSTTELKRQRHKLYLMAAAFFVLFYPFPAGMVLYWTATNALQIVQQRWLRI